SGKTTFLNALNGIVPATGSVKIGGRRVRLGKPGRIRKLGVLRTYQAPQTYLELTCIADVLLSTPERGLTGIIASWLLRPEVGRLVAVGAASTVFSDQRVVDAYLGVDEEDRADA